MILARFRAVLAGMALAAAGAVAGVGAIPAMAASPAPGWSIASLAQPTNFSSVDNGECKAKGICDSYTLLVTNAGSRATDGSTVTITDTLPPGLKVVHIHAPTRAAVGGHSGHEGFGDEWMLSHLFPCMPTEAKSKEWQVTCTYSNVFVYNSTTEKYEEGTTKQPSLAAGDTLDVRIEVEVESTGDQRVLNRATVEGGGIATAVSTGEPTTVANTVNGPPAPFGVQDFSFEVHGMDGSSDLQAGDHLYSVMSGFDLNSKLRAEHAGNETTYEPVQAMKDVVMHLPLGLVGDPLAAPTCAAASLRTTTNQGVPGLLTCTAGSMLGTLSINASGTPSPSILDKEVSGLYNIVPEAGYPDEIGAWYVSAPVVLHTSVVPSPAGYMLRVASTGIPNVDFTGQIDGVSLTIFGTPSEGNSSGNPPTAFFTNPDNCSPAPLKAKIEVDSWQNPGEWVSTPEEAVAYPHIEGCNMLQFDPAITVEPEAAQTRTDTPSGYEVEMKVPQAANMWPQLATPDLKNATVTLPQGVVVSPSAANGLVGCKEKTPEGIEFPKGGLPPDQAGEGEEIGPDGLSRLAPGHCPAESQIGEVEVTTPLLAHPLKGHVYVAQPQCGGAGQHECTEASAANGELYGLYLEASGSGVIVKLKGKVSADPATGQLTTTFMENPQLPFDDFKLRLYGGQQAPLANPQTCGRATTTSDLVPWSTPYTPDATPSSFFDVTGCVNPMPFAPGFSAGTVQTLGGGFTPFTMTLTRKDGEQDLAGVSLTMPPGVAGLVSTVPLCPEPQASLGTCSAASKIGTVNAAAGAGSEPLWLSGPVYLTGPYKGAPFGLSVVVPAVAGPFNLGNVIERAAINLDPHTAQVTVTSDPFPQIRDGVPLRLKTVNVTVDRPEFMFNPTNCTQLHVTGAVSGDLPSGAAGATVPVSTPFAVAGCKNLPFKPGFSALTHATHSRANGEYLHVVVQSGAGQANIAKVHVELPKALPSRLSTLKLACTEAQFAANPAGCPSGSFVGTATAYTPILPVPLTGPAIFVSHGGAAFPNLDLVLQGDGVTVMLVGETFIDKHGITSSTFATVPDVPITRFDLVLPSGPHSALSANGNLCATTLSMPTTITGQNGAVIKERTRIAVAGCKAAIRVLSHKVNGATATVVVHVPSAGTLVATGSAIKRSTKRAAKAGTVTIGVTLTSHGLRVLAKNPHQRVNAKVKLRFTPKHGAPLTATVRLLMG